MKHKAFISYSHSADSDLAPSIERALERFAKPTFKRRALNVFRDSNDLSASPDLWGKIQSGLAQSEYFIFFASALAAESKWCRKEIDFWKANKPLANFLVVLTDGELVWDDARRDFDWERTNSLPDNLSGVFENEPLYVDFRELPASLTLDDPDFSNKIVLLAATLHGRSVGDMIGEDVRQHKRTLRIRNGTIGVLSSLLVATVALASFAFQQKGIAEREKEEAVRQTNRALARSYLSYAKANLTTNPTLSMRLAEHGYRFAKANHLPPEDFEDQLITSFYQNSNFYLPNTGIDTDFRAVHASGRQNLVPYDDGADGNHRPAVHASGGRTLSLKDDVLYLSTAGSEPIPLDLPDFGYAINELSSYSFSPRGQFVVTVARGFQNAGQHFDTLTAFDLRGKKLLQAESMTTFGHNSFYPPAIRFNVEETRLLAFGYNTGVRLYELAGDSVKDKVLHSEAKNALDIDMTADGSHAAYGTKSGTVHVQRLGQNNVEDHWQLSGHAIEPVHAVTFSKDGRHLHTASESFRRRWRADNDAWRKYVVLTRSPQYDSLNDVETVGAQGTMNFALREGDASLVYIDDAGEKIAEIPAQQSSEPGKWISPDRRYYATRNGLFSSQGERLVAFSEDRYAYKYDIYVIGFSSDSKHFFMIDRLLFLDAETILSRLNDESLFGQIAPLEPGEREQYGVQ